MMSAAPSPASSSCSGATHKTRKDHSQCMGRGKIPSSRTLATPRTSVSYATLKGMILSEERAPTQSAIFFNLCRDGSGKKRETAHSLRNAPLATLLQEALLFQVDQIDNRLRAQEVARVQALNLIWATTPVSTRRQPHSLRARVPTSPAFQLPQRTSLPASRCSFTFSKNAFVDINHTVGKGQH